MTSPPSKAEMSSGMAISMAAWAQYFSTAPMGRQGGAMFTRAARKALTRSSTSPQAGQVFLCLVLPRRPTENQAGSCKKFSSIRKVPAVLAGRISDRGCDSITFPRGDLKISVRHQNVELTKKRVDVGQMKRAVPTACFPHDNKSRQLTNTALARRLGTLHLPNITPRHIRHH
jgi:hypothetical protein